MLLVACSRLRVWSQSATVSTIAWCWRIPREEWCELLVEREWGRSSLWSCGASNVGREILFLRGTPGQGATRCFRPRLVEAGRPCRIGIETPVAAALPGSGGGLWIIGVILTEPMDFKRSGRFRLQRDIGYWKGLGRVDKVASVGGPQFVGTTRVPAGPRSIFAAGDGLMFLTEGEQPTVSILETSGFMRRKIRVEGMAIEIADAMHEPYVETLVAQQEEARGRAGYDPSSAAEGVARALRAAPLPKEMEAIGRIVFGRDGTLWLCQRGWPGVDEHWVNVTTEGVPIRRVLMPSKMTMLDAAEDRLLLAWLDSMDLTRVEVHAIVAVPG